MADVEDADIVFIASSPSPPVRGYELADHLRVTGVAVVLGGLHASMNCAEAARHCDYVLLGEGDETVRAFVEAGGPRGAAGLPRSGLDGGGGAALHRLSAPAGALRDDCRP